MISTGHRPFSNFCPAMKGLILQLIRDEYQPLLQLPPTLSAEAWSEAVTKANPILFYLNDGAPLIQIGEASRQSLLKFLKQQFGSAQ
ncbi:hypothetical protein ACFST9_13925 [Hymenobacter monticola]|jgi:hypothetical protein|uniref:Uncharacterized protein n=3 Tax=Hymenobacter TaxID=89966 RepID=A0ABY4BCE2_9BACT|nr:MULTISPECIES: hypothetical protein [Hymenobacter]MBG8555814.1 hypothetical protein [Hymenobacter guriensis]MDU0372286.1 hypothetical protein [Hymenobacter endophyticus]UOE36564.1 hypothetical protein MTP16_24620 [Hymenobacter monticola]